VSELISYTYTPATAATVTEIPVVYESLTRSLPATESDGTHSHIRFWPCSPVTMCPACAGSVKFSYFSDSTCLFEVRIDVQLPIAP
jgi:hypothetical protein